MAKRPSEQTLLKYRLALAREEMIKKITGFIEKRPNAELLKIYRHFFRDDIHSLAIASSLPSDVCTYCKGKGFISDYIGVGIIDNDCKHCQGTGKICTDPKPSSEQPIASSKPNSPV